MLRLAHDIAPTPAAPTRILLTIQAVADQAEKCRGIAFHNKQVLQVAFAHRSDVADIFIQPVLGHGGEICPRRVAIVLIAADAGPGGAGIIFAVLA